MAVIGIPNCSEIRPIELGCGITVTAVIQPEGLVRVPTLGIYRAESYEQAAQLAREWMNGKANSISA